MTREELLAHVTDLSIWKRRGERAPHKPLLVLWALGRLGREEQRLTSYQEVDEPLRDLLERFGPARSVYHPEYPFWHLQGDDIWVVREAAQVETSSGGSPTRSALLRADAHGGFRENVEALFRAHPELVGEVARRLLDAHFPESLHEDILDAVGLAPGLDTVTRARRDPRFRQEVIRAYEHRCAICGYDVRLDNRTVGLEAAHIRWFQAGGPDTVDNGLALCTLHHKALDLGAIGLSEDLRVLVSVSVHGQHGFEPWFLQYLGQPIRMPQSAYQPPRAEHVRWHRREVFRGREREAAD